MLSQNESEISGRSPARGTPLPAAISGNPRNCVQFYGLTPSLHRTSPFLFCCGNAKKPPHTFHSTITRPPATISAPPASTGAGGDWPNRTRATICAATKNRTT